MIEAQGLVRKYGDFIAVDNVSFSIPHNQIVGLLGHNGAGKTTILKMLTGVLEPTEGRVLIEGTDTANDRLLAQRRIGYLPETCPLYPEMAVVEYLEYVAELRGIPKEQQLLAVKEAIANTELLEKARNPIGTLSKGYRQRVGVAQALLHNPEILILDEPTSGLDPSQINHMRSLIRTLSKKSTVILSTHVLQEVEAVCDRVIILSRGKVAVDSDMESLQSSNRLVLYVDRGPEDVRKTLHGIAGIRAMTVLSMTDGEGRYAIDCDGEVNALGAATAKAVVDSGMRLYSLQTEKRTLETIFREIHSGTPERVNA